MIRDVLALLAANACFLAAGAGITRLLGLWYEPRSLPRALGLAYMAGVAAVGVLATLALLAGLSLALWQVLLLCAAPALLGLLARPGRSPLGPAAPLGSSARWVVVGLGGLLAGYLLVLLAHAALEPLRHWDAWAMWTMKARAIVLLDGLDTRLFAGEAYRALHRDYPLFVPALEAIDFRFMGRIGTRVVDVQFWLLYVGFLVAVAQLLRDRVPPLLLWPALFSLGTAPSLALQLRWSIADFPLALFFGLAVLAGWRYLEEGATPLLGLLALFAGAAWATKREGLAFVAILYLLLFVFARAGRRPLLPLAGAALASLVAIVPWRLWVNVHGLEPGELPLAKAINPAYLLDRTDRLEPAVRQLALETVKPTWWLAVFPLFALACLLVLWSGRGRGAAVFGLTLVTLMFAALLWAYWGDVPEIHGHARRTGRRVVLSVLVAAAVLFPLLASRLVPLVAAGRSERRAGAPEEAPPPVRA